MDIFRYVGITDICNLKLTSQYVNIICASNYLWKFLLERDSPQAIPLLDDTVLSASSVMYRVLYSATLSSKKNELSLSSDDGNVNCLATLKTERQYCAGFMKVDVFFSFWVVEREVGQ